MLLLSDPNLNPKIVQELDRVNKIWANLLENIHEKDNLERIKAILVQVMIEYYVDRILILSEIIEKPEAQMRYDQRLDELIKLNIINENDRHDYLRIYDIRNIYAHEIDIRPQKILDLLNGVKTVANPGRFSDDEKFDMIVQIQLRKIQRAFMELLVRNQEKFDEKTTEDDLESFRSIFG